MKYISVLEYLMDRIQIEDLPKEHFENINTLIPKINDLLERFGEYRKVNSGYRSLQDQIRIYREKAQKEGKPFDEKKVPMGSLHLKGAAVDLEDKNDKLKQWIKNNVKVLEEIGLWCEDFSATDTWVHLQCFPPKSGNRFFHP